MGLCRNYFWATATIYGRAWLSRVARTLYTTGLGLPRTIELGGPNVPSASPPARPKSVPGQHFFMRVLCLGMCAL
ncbi:hypothetical protein B0H14DRAFT_2710295, partial [Mycena olivaceomarginata]